MNDMFSRSTWLRSTSQGWGDPRGRDTLIDQPRRVDVDSALQVDTSLPRIARKSGIRAAVEAAVASCTLPVTLAEPGNGGIITVSPGFEKLTGAPKETLLASSLRCLGTDLLWQDPSDLMRLRIAEKTGKEATGLLSMRRLTGEHLEVMVHLRGLIVGQDQITGEEMWFLIGLYIDMADTEKDASEVLKSLATHIIAQEEQVQNTVTHHLTSAVTDVPEVAITSVASESLQLVTPVCRWMPSPKIE